MGFDNECIIGIHNYPGEYFCPVCRTLVYPNEALQSPCTHLYCKPCLAHIVHNSRACPYDGYLVTEVSSKPLVESDKALAENIGKVKVRCLYHRSGCAWEGRLYECMSHCSACAFGNSPVICNRCGNQIVHSQVHDHAQSCPGVYQVQQAAGAAQVAPSFSLTAVTGAVPNQASSQAGAPTSQAQNSQIAPAPFLPGQDSNQQANANSQAPAAVPASVPMTEQWYQQQYQQYYQQYAGYDPYQQAYLQYYPYQQLYAQQYQQHPPLVLGQPQLQVYAQAAAQVQAQSSSHPQIQPQAQPQPQHPVQSQAQPQPPAQTQVVPSQVKTQAQVQPHGPPLLHSQLQPLAPQNRNQAQELLYPAMHSHAQNPSQAHSVHGLSAAQPQPQPQPQPQSQHAQAHYQQPHLPMHHPQPSQVLPQSHLLTQTRSQPQSQSQIQPQPLLQTHMRPTQPNQPTALSAQPQSVHSSGPVVSGHQSYLQPQPPQQQPIPAQLASGSLPPVQMQGQVLPQPPLKRPPSSQVPVPNQQQALFPSQGQVPSMPPAQQQQFHSQTPQLSHSNQRHPVIHSTQHSVPQQYVQQPPFSSTVQSQLSDNNHLLQQPPLQSQLLPQGPPHMMQQSSNAHLQLQQNVAVGPGVQPQQPQNYVGRPLMPNQGVPTQPLPFAQSSSGFLAGSQGMPAQFGPFQHSANQDYANKMNIQLQTAADQQLIQSGMTLTSGRMLRQGDSVSEKTSIVYESGLPPQNPVGKVANTRRVDSFELKPQKSEVGISYEQDTARESTDKSRKNESLARDADYGLRGGIDGPERQFALQRSANPAEVEMLQNQSHFDGDHMKLPGSFERGPFGHHSGVEPNALRMNVGSGLHKSSLVSHDERFKAMSGGHMSPFAKETTWPQEQGSRSLDRPPTALNYAAGRTLGSAAGGLTTRVLPPLHASGPGIVRHNGKNLISGSPDKDYLGMKISSSGEGSRRNLPLDPQGNPFHENRFLPLPGYPLRGEHDGPKGSRFGEHRVPGHHDHLRRADMFGTDIQPSHFPRGEFLGSGTSSSHFGPFPGHAQVGELPGPANPPHKFHYGEPYADNKPGLPRLGEPGIRSSFSLPGFPSDGPYAGDIGKFDNSRKRKHPSMGWCRICKVDCETVEGLDMHSQTGEHQHMSMHMVMSIKQQNKKKSKPSSDCAREEIGSNKRNSGPDGRGKKP